MPSPARTLTTSVTIAFTLAVAAHAQNQVPTNPEFGGFTDGAFPGWIEEGAPSEPGEDSDLCPDSDSYRIQEDSSGSAGARSADCIADLPFPVELHLEITYRSDAPVDVRLDQFTGSQCTGALAGTGDPPSLAESAEWTTVRLQKSTLNASVRSVRLHLEVEDDEAYFVDFDRVYAGFEERVFSDDFEGGKYCRWDDFVEAAGE
jgi:hypothetical protein